MTHYDIRLYNDKGVHIHSTGVECRQADVLGMLACIVMDYLEDAPYPGVMKAYVITDRRYTKYTIHLKNDSLDMYRHVYHADRVKVREPPMDPPGSATLRDREKPA